MTSPHDQSLASYRRCTERVAAAWPAFRAARDDRLRHRGESEKVAEAITEDLFTQVLDWTKGDLLYQVGYADIVVSHHLVKYLVIEVKRPGTLFPGRRALESALAQARRYAGEQRICSVAATDGRFFYAADISGGGLIDRAVVDLSRVDPSADLWNLSVHGIYRPPACTPGSVEILAQTPLDALEEEGTTLLHPKYKLPATCFAYVPDASRPTTWKLPYLLADGTVDTQRLPKAIQAILRNYRGTKVTGIPEADMGAVLMRLARAASREGRMPPQSPSPADIYKDLAHVLDQHGLLGQIASDAG